MGVMQRVRQFGQLCIYGRATGVQTRHTHPAYPRGTIVRKCTHKAHTHGHTARPCGSGEPFRRTELSCGMVYCLVVGYPEYERFLRPRRTSPHAGTRHDAPSTVKSMVHAPRSRVRHAAREFQRRAARQPEGRCGCSPLALPGGRERVAPSRPAARERGRKYGTCACGNHKVLGILF